MKLNRSQFVAITITMLLSVCFSMNVLANSATHTGTLESNGKTLTHKETYTGTLQKMQAIVSCPGARCAEVSMDAYYSTGAGGGNVYPAPGNPYRQYIEPGVSAGVTYNPSTGAYCYSASARYYIDNARVWMNTFYGYK